jgi:N-acetylmuramoyl-L-alanine amidase
MNLNEHVKIRFTRENDKTIELRERVAFINEIKPDLVLSLHIASHKESSVSGIEIFVSEESKEYEQSNILAEKLKDKFISKNMRRVAQVKTANFFIMERSNHPALTLELGFLTNETDRLILLNPEEQANIAQTILEFISEL